MHSRPLLLMLIPLFLFCLCIQAGAGPFSPPLGERWFTILSRGERVGFARTAITEEGTHFRVDAESSTKMSGFGFSRDAVIREQYLVDAALTIKSFSADLVIDGKRRLISGTMGSGNLVITEEKGGKKKTGSLPVQGPVYPGPILNMIPLVKIPEHKEKYSTLDIEEGRLKGVTYELVEIERGDGRTLLHLRNDLFPVVANDIWVDDLGNTRKESVREGLVETVAEEPRAAKVALALDALAAKDYAEMFGVIPPPAQVPAEERLQEMTVVLAGALPMVLPFARQTSQALEIKVRRDLPPGQGGNPQVHLSDNPWFAVSAAGIGARAAELVQDETDPLEKLAAIHGFVARLKETEGRISPAEAAEKGEASGIDRARLLVSLLRRSGVPARLVAGIAYQGKGFVYRAWVEAYAEGWIPVDPYGALPASLARVGLITVEEEKDLAPLADVMGRIRLARIGFKLRSP